jgi:hypothetical protein
MNEILTPEQWSELQGRIRKLYPELTDEDLQYHESTEPDMLSMVDYSLQKAKTIMPGRKERQNRIPTLNTFRKYCRMSQLNQKM